MSSRVHTKTTDEVNPETHLKRYSASKLTVSVGIHEAEDRNSRTVILCDGLGGAFTYNFRRAFLRALHPLALLAASFRIIVVPNNSRYTNIRTNRRPCCAAVDIPNREPTSTNEIHFVRLTVQTATHIEYCVFGHHGSAWGRPLSVWRIKNVPQTRVC